MLNNKKGAALAMVLLILAVGMVLSIAALLVGQGELFQTAAQEKYIQAHYNARSAAAAFGQKIMETPEIAPADGASETGTVDFDSQGMQGTANVTVSRVGDFVYIEAVGNSAEGFSRTTVLRLEALDPDLLPFQNPIVSDEGINLTNLWVDAVPGVDDFHVLSVEDSTNADRVEPEDYNGLDFAAGNVEEDAFDSFPPVVIPTSPTPVTRDTNDFSDGVILNQLSGSNSVPINFSGSINRNGNVEFRTNDKDMTIIVQDCRISGIISITGTGNVKLYVKTPTSSSQQLDISSSNTDISAPPEKFIVFLADGASMSIQGNSTFRGYVYGPDSEGVTLQGGGGSPTSIEGAIISSMVVLSGNPHFLFNPLENPEDYMDIEAGFGISAWLDEVPD